MKHVVNILIALILVGFAVGITVVQLEHPDQAWAILFAPLIIGMMAWGMHLMLTYSH